MNRALGLVAGAAIFSGVTGVHGLSEKGIRSGFPSEPMASLLEQREAELRELRRRIEALDNTEERRLYEVATSLGITAAVDQTGLPSRQCKRLAIAIVREAREHGVDPLLVVALIRTESSFNNYAQSKAGALGLMQVMPDTGKWIASRRGVPLPRKSHLFDSELNVELGTAYLANLIERFGSLEAALVAYNAGPGAARKILADRRSRTRFLAGYPNKVVRELRRLKAQAGIARPLVPSTVPAGRVEPRAAQPSPGGKSRPSTAATRVITLGGSA